MENPRPEDFYTRRRKADTPLQQFMKSLEIGVPTRAPDDISKATSIYGRRGSIQHAAGDQKMSVKTTIRDGELWVMRIA